MAEEALEEGPIIGEEEEGSGEEASQEEISESGAAAVSSSSAAAQSTAAATSASSKSKNKNVLSGRGVNLSMLLQDGILETGEALLSIDYLGTKFIGDLLPKGRIKCRQTKKMFASPSSWAIYCKKLLNPDKRSGCGWSSIRYKGKKLDSYKSMWFKKLKQQQQQELAKANAALAAATGGSTATTTVAVAPTAATVTTSTAATTTESQATVTSSTATSAMAKQSPTLLATLTSPTPSALVTALSSAPVATTSSLFNSSSTPSATVTSSQSEASPLLFKEAHKKSFMNIETLLSKSTEKAGATSAITTSRLQAAIQAPRATTTSNQAVSNKSYASCIPFNSLDRRQPFNISIASNCLLLVDFHCHLTKNEVVGYLGGTWDPATCNLAILQAFPCRTKLGDNDNAQVVEEEIRRAMEQRHLAPVGWYHSHPYCPARPTVQDTKLQQGYQAALRGPSDSPGLPCIGLICAPYTDKNHFEAEYLCYWVLSEGETKLEVVGQPMQMMYNMSHDSFLTQDLLTEMRLLSDYYRGATDAIHFTVPFQQGLSHWEKLKCSLRSKLPRDLQPLGSPSSAQAQAVTHFWDFLKGLILT